MQSLWNDTEAATFGTDLLGQRVYTSRLLGRNPALVLHGGGNTSVKVTEKDFFGDDVDLCYVKGSGWDLATIEREGFSPVRQDALIKMSKLPTMSDADMVLQQRAAMTNPNAPAASIEAILHAILPFRFVDHSHANAISALTCNAEGEARVKEVFGDRVIIVPYVMPGFILAKTVADLIAGRDLRAEGIQGMVLLKHGLFTFDDDARKSYELHIEMVTMAEEYLAKKSDGAVAASQVANEDLLALATLRQAVSKVRGFPQIARLNASAEAAGYAGLEQVADFGTRGPLTPDHSIRTKRAPAFIGADIAASVQKFAEDYKTYFERNASGHTMLDAAPRFAIWPNQGVVSFGDTLKDANIVFDISESTASTVQLAERVGGWEPLPEKDIFEIEYWELEQAKLRKGPARKVHQGKVAIVTGCAAGIGFAIAESLAEQGAQVVGLDIDKDIPEIMKKIGGIGIVVNLTEDKPVQDAIEFVVREFGGIDIVVSNAGIFPKNEPLDTMQQNDWDRTISINLTSHQKLMNKVIPFVKLGLDASIIFVGSRNFKAPGPGASAYSCSKAALTQLCRVAALELAPNRVRVNIVHPDAVFDTKLWTPEALQRSAERYGMTVDEYKTKNLMKVEIKSKDIGNMVSAMASPLFAKVTGAQIPVDGGNDRVI
ncbi:rhamnose utilization protein RhaD (predicted bifunctional aldolase and dehydrogenase) [Prosthecobacter fusiformis]|uniref:Rhamnose utilization protein RhaD (Predicted bifunctional aldolase and dehydrogenase) n=1 Tax=Prosthecobacter fusiformis TaxID=48464 RepID=A0A4R7RPE9_9BACT|nr:bifunctional aldolase/short-chain dehydrogenase [Prosthecobacter fusiformis]TDU67312.1 rhamnose utilization protein RhaD (predicted bifunctional aldolase and dehydrogenase) [Prosthecobacter fusiformis]